MAWSRLYLDEMARIQEKLQGLFERALLPSGYPGQDGTLGSWSPPVDLVDTGEAYRLDAELPGASRDDVELSIQGQTLELSGRVPLPGDGGAGDDTAARDGQDEGGSGRSFLRMERHYGPFRRVFQLDAAVDSEAVSAELQQGVLTVTIPKRAAGHKVTVDGPEGPEGDEP